jgi:hypothetical protein
VVRVEARPSDDGGWTCQVIIEVGRQLTEHTVGVSVADVARWGHGTLKADVEDLVRRSFDFLLQREPQGSILPRFDLSVIESYFPEYDELIRD